MGRPSEGMERMTAIVTGLFVPGDLRFLGAETHPTAAPPHRLGRAARARKPPPSSAPRSAPGAPIPPAAVPHPLAGAIRGCGAASAGSPPWEDPAGGTTAKLPTRQNSAAAVFRS